MESLVDLRPQTRELGEAPIPVIQRRLELGDLLILLNAQESPAHFETNTCWTFTEATSDADVAAELRRSGFYDAVPDEFWDLSLIHI